MFDEAQQEYAPGAHGPLDPALSAGAYGQVFAALQEAIAAGDIYQANLTFPLAGSWRGSRLLTALLVVTMTSMFVFALFFLRAMMMLFKPKFIFGENPEALFAAPGPALLESQP